MNSYDYHRKNTQQKSRNAESVNDINVVVSDQNDVIRKPYERSNTMEGGLSKQDVTSSGKSSKSVDNLSHVNSDRAARLLHHHVHGVEESSKKLPDVLINDEYNSGRIRSLRLEKPELEDMNIGFNLTRSQWDPYPWVKCVDKNSCAERAGLQEGDCLIKIGDEDLLGLKVTDVASLVRSQQREVSILVWSAGSTRDGDSDALLLGPLPLALTRLSSCLASILRAAECPVCARTIPAPAHQCVSGHLLCSTCRSRMEFCPLCRAPIGVCRNLLADEVYNCVLENFDLRADKKERLTKSLFGEDAKFIENHRNRQLGNFQYPSSPAKWGTQKLLDKLLPGRARSTGNIARIGSRNATLAEDNAVSRSLSTLDIARCSTEVSPCHSLPSTAAVSCDSLHNTRYAADQSEISSRTIKEEQTLRYNCPIDSNCKGTIAGDVQSHIVLSHDTEVLMKQSDNHIQMKNREGAMVSLLHKSGLWFYPKFHRDELNKGIKIWCWTVATSQTASKYHMSVEVHKKSKPKITQNEKSSNEKCENTEVVVSAMIHSTDEISKDKDNNINGHAKLRRLSEDIDDGICILMDNAKKEIEDLSKAVLVGNNNKEEIGKTAKPILKFSAPVFSLIEVGWNDILEHANKSVFLSDYILEDGVDVFAIVEEIH